VASFFLFYAPCFLTHFVFYTSSLFSIFNFSWFSTKINIPLSLAWYIRSVWFVGFRLFQSDFLIFSFIFKLYLFLSFSFYSFFLSVFLSFFLSLLFSFFLSFFILLILTNLVLSSLFYQFFFCLLITL
jgi:hypothetical protein